LFSTSSDNLLKPLTQKQSTGAWEATGKAAKSEQADRLDKPTELAKSSKLTEPARVVFNGMDSISNTGTSDASISDTIIARAGPTSSTTTAIRPSHSHVIEISGTSQDRPHPSPASCPQHVLRPPARLLCSVHARQSEKCYTHSFAALSTTHTSPIPANQQWLLNHQAKPHRHRHPRTRSPMWLHCNWRHFVHRLPSQWVKGMSGLGNPLA